MDIYEYQNKRVFKEHRFPTLKGKVAYSAQDAKEIAQNMNLATYCVKAQVHGESLKSGYIALSDDTKMPAICFASSPDEVFDITQKMLSNPFCLHDNPTPYQITRVYVEEKYTCKNRISLAFRIDATMQCVVLSVLARKKIKSFKIEDEKISSFMMMRILHHTNLSGILQKKMHVLINKTYALFLHYKAIAVELNPILITDENKLIIANGRIIYDDEALVFFPEIKALKEALIGQERKNQIEQFNIRYFSFSGNIACIVNGAGIGASTLDLLESKGGKPACLFDIGAEPTPQMIAQAFKLTLSEANVEGVLINIFGGIARCDVLVQGLIDAAKEIAVGIPMVVRIEGINAQVGIRLLFESNLPFTVLTNLHDSVKTIINQVESLS